MSIIEYFEAYREVHADMYAQGRILAGLEPGNREEASMGHALAAKAAYDLCHSNHFYWALAEDAIYID